MRKQCNIDNIVFKNFSFFLHQSSVRTWERVMCRTRKQIYCKLNLNFTTSREFFKPVYIHKVLESSNLRQRHVSDSSITSSATKNRLPIGQSGQINFVISSLHTIKSRTTKGLFPTVASKGNLLFINFWRFTPVSGSISSTTFSQQRQGVLPEKRKNTIFCME